MCTMIRTERARRGKETLNSLTTSGLQELQKKELKSTKTEERQEARFPENKGKGYSQEPAAS